jgi:hypothetical protein
MQTTTVIDKDGQRRALRDGDILEDGERLVVGLNMLDQASLDLHDGMGHPAGFKPGYVFAQGSSRQVSDAALASARAEYEARLTGAWRDGRTNPLPLADDSKDPYAAYEQRVTNAWRTT